MYHDISPNAYWFTTHKQPIKKTLATAIFLALVICNLKIMGIGNTSTRTSPKKDSAALTEAEIAWFRHFPPAIVLS